MVDKQVKCRQTKSVAKEKKQRSAYETWSKYYNYSALAFKGKKLFYFLAPHTSIEAQSSSLISFHKLVHRNKTIQHVVPDTHKYLFLAFFLSATTSFDANIAFAITAVVLQTSMLFLQQPHCEKQVTEDSTHLWKLPFVLDSKMMGMTALDLGGTTCDSGLLWRSSRQSICRIQKWKH